MKFFTLLRKEWIESVRTYRVLIVPLVFLLLGMGQPLTYHFMPQLMEQAGLPDGFVITIPTIAPHDIVVSVFDQFNQIGVLTVILVCMGVVSREIQTGRAGLLSSWGFSRLSYFFAKWTVLAGIVVFSVVIGTIGTAYYTNVLFGAVAWGNVISAACMYSMHLLFVLTLTMALNTIIPGAFPSAAASLGINIVFGLLGMMWEKVLRWLPGYASVVAKSYVSGTHPDTMMRLIIPALWIGVSFYIGYANLRRTDL